VLISLALSIWLHAAVSSRPVNNQPASSIQRSALTGVYRIDIPASDKLYSVVAGASSKVPFGEQQRFFIDLAVRLTPPDLLAIEQKGQRISLGSSRAPRMTFLADGATHISRASDGHPVRVKFAIESERLVFTSSGRTEDNFTIVFESVDDGKRLQVVRQLTAEALDQPLVIHTVYNKISEVADWELYGEAQLTASVKTPSAAPADEAVRGERGVRGERVASLAPDDLRRALSEWIRATNNRDIEKQMSFYVPRLKAYYLSRNTPREFVRDEKTRVFATAAVIDIQAEEPEIIFQDGGNTAVMRYRKKYRIVNGRHSRRGEGIQELRWQRVEDGWRIFSERDIRVL
jgi:hypothetical protein